MTRSIRLLPVAGAAVAASLAAGLIGPAVQAQAADLSQPAAGGPVTSAPSAPRWAAANMLGRLTVTLDQALEIARTNDIVTAGPATFRGMVDAMKAENPNLRVFAYVNGTFSQEDEHETFPADWYLRTAAGVQVNSRGYSNHAMDARQPGWVVDRVALCNTRMAVGGYDGCMFDMLGTAPLDGDYLDGVPIDPLTGAAYTKPAWLATNRALLGQLREALAPAAVLGNGLGNGQRYKPSTGTRGLTDVSDGVVAEAFLRAGPTPLTLFPSEAGFKANVDMLVDAGSRGRSVLAMTKTWAAGTPEQLRAWKRYALGAFLLGQGGGSYFSFVADPSADSVLLGGGDERVAIGTPDGGYSRTIDGVYTRSYTGGLVVVNAGKTRQVVQLGRPMTDLDGNTVSSVTLLPHGAQVFRG